jgi:hypothetical protein
MRSILSKSIALLACLALHAQGARAQAVVRGIVVERDGSTGVAGIVVHVERAGSVIARALTSESGDFSALVPESGRYTIRAQRIGFRPVALEISVGAGPLDPVRLRMADQIETLAMVRVVRQERCGSAIERTPALQALWLEAVKALEATAVAGHEKRKPRSVRRYIHDFAADGRTVLADSSWILRGAVGPYRSVPASILATSGYVAIDSTEHTYYAPDLEVLISESFLATHCFAMDR